MIFLINCSKYTIWLPVYSLSDYPLHDPFYKFLLFIGCFLSLIALAYTLITTYIMITSRAFHRNLNSLLAVFMFGWLMSLVSRVFLVPYIIGLSSIPSVTSQHRHWWTRDVEQMAPVESIRDNWPLFVGGFLAWYYMFIMVTCLFTLSMERTFASLFIRDYEKTSRTYIFLLLLCFQHSLVFLMTYVCFWNLVHFAPAISFCIAINFAAVVVFFLNQRYNARLIRDMDRTSLTKKVCDLRTLPVRYQAKENIRSFNLTIRVIVCGFVLIISAITFIIFLTYKLFPSLETMLVYGYENIIHLNPLIICPVLIFSVSTWSKALLSSRGHWLQRITNIDLPKIPIGVAGSQQHETDTYFTQLKTSWEHRTKV